MLHSLPDERAKRKRRQWRILLRPLSEAAAPADEMT